MKKFLGSAFFGVLALFAVNFSAVFTGVSLGINTISLCISIILGIPGVITMLSLGYIMQ